MSTITPRLTTHEVTQLRTAQDRGYLLDRSRRRVCLAAHWWRRCEEKHRPFVIIKTTRRQASVIVDLLPASTQFSEAALKQVRRLFLRYRGPRSILFPGRNQVAMYRIPVASVEELVGALQRLVRPLNNLYELRR